MIDNSNQRYRLLVAAYTHCLTHAKLWKTIELAYPNLDRSALGEAFRQQAAIVRLSWELEFYQTYQIVSARQHDSCYRVTFLTDAAAVNLVKFVTAAQITYNHGTIATACGRDVICNDGRITLLNMLSNMAFGNRPNNGAQLPASFTTINRLVGYDRLVERLNCLLHPSRAAFDLILTTFDVTQ